MVYEKRSEDTGKNGEGGITEETMMVNKKKRCALYGRGNQLYCPNRKKNRQDTNNYQGSRKISRDKGFEV